LYVASGRTLAKKSRIALDARSIVPVSAAAVSTTIRPAS
jgi:hypothetical protein